LFNIFLVFLMFFFNSAEVLAEGDAAFPYAAATGNVESDRHHDETVGNGTAAGDVDDGSNADEPVTEEQASPAALDERVYHFDPVRVLGEKQQAGKASIGGQELRPCPPIPGPSPRPSRASPMSSSPTTKSRASPAGKSARPASPFPAPNPTKTTFSSTA
jgi:hypothetical protein